MVLFVSDEIDELLNLSVWICPLMLLFPLLLSIPRLKGFFFFYVYNPNLIGEIPERIGDMVYLEKLVMSQNGL